ncbi:transposase family protein [Pseudanabaena minima]|uniref:transposase family protein n=1 Tax=Pseudanabaena minima TaxID=890415 RepID=UPI003DA89B9F
MQPKKKPRGGELTDAEKERNRQISKQRIVVEHHIVGVKRSRIVHDTFRNRKLNYDDVVMETSCGLHNFRVTMRQRKSA